MFQRIVKVGMLFLLSAPLIAVAQGEDVTRLEATEAQAEARALNLELEDLGGVPPTLRDAVDDARRRETDGGILLTKNRFADAVAAFREASDRYQSAINDYAVHQEWLTLEKRLDRARMLAVGASGEELEEATTALGKARDLFTAGHREDALQALDAAARLYEALGPDKEAASVDRTKASRKRMESAKNRVVHLERYDVATDHRVQKNGSLLFFLHRAQTSEQSGLDALAEGQQREAEALFTAAANQYTRAAALQEKQRLVHAAIEAVDAARKKASDTLQTEQSSAALERGIKALDNAREISNDAATREELEMAERMIDEARQDFAQTIATAQLALLQNARKTYRAALARTDEALLKQHANYEYEGALALYRHGEDMATETEFEDAIAAVLRAAEALDRATELAEANRKKHEADVALVSSRLERALADANRDEAEIALAELENLLGESHRQVNTYRMSVASLVQPNPEDAYDISTLDGSKEAWEAVLARVNRDGLSMRAAMALEDAKTTAANANSKALVGEEQVAIRMYNQAREALSRAVIESRMRGAEPVIAQLEHALEAKDAKAARVYLNKIAVLIPNDPRLVDYRVQVALLTSALGELEEAAREAEKQAAVDPDSAPESKELMLAAEELAKVEAALDGQELADSERMISAAEEMLTDGAQDGKAPDSLETATDAEGNIVLTEDELIAHNATLLDAVNARTDATVLRRRAKELDPAVLAVMERIMLSAETRMRDGNQLLTRERYPQSVQAYNDASAYYRGVLDSSDLLDRLAMTQDEVAKARLVASIFTDVSTLAQAQRHEHNAEGYVQASEIETAITELQRARDIYQAYVPYEAKASLEDAVATRTAMLAIRNQFPELSEADLPKTHYQRSIRQSLWELAVLRTTEVDRLTRDNRRDQVLDHALQTERTANRALWEHRYALAKSLYSSATELFAEALELTERGTPLRPHASDASHAPAPARAFHGARLYRVPTKLAPDASLRADLAASTEFLKPAKFLERVGGDAAAFPKARTLTLRPARPASTLPVAPSAAAPKKPMATPAIFAPTAPTPAPVPRAQPSEILPTEADVAVSEAPEAPSISGTSSEPLVSGLVQARENLARSRVYFQADWLSNLDREDELIKLRQAAIETMAEAEDSFSEMQNYPEAFDRGLRSLELAQEAADKDLYHTAKAELVKATELFAYVRDEAERLAAMRGAQDIASPTGKTLPVQHRVQSVLEHYLTRQQRTIIAPLILKLEHAFAVQDGLRAEAVIDELESLLPDGPVLSELRSLANNLPRPKKYLTLDLGNDVQMEFVLVRPGSFIMDVETDAGIQKHKVHVEAPYYIGRFEVTQAQWEAVMGYNPSTFVDPQNPVESISWEEVQTFMGRLREMYWYLRVGLPTEQQWEHACRAGSSGRYTFGRDPGLLEDYAWYRGNAEGGPHHVGQKKPNAWGLYDMHGNVREWCSNWYVPTRVRTIGTPRPLDSKDDHLATRGGSYRNAPNYCETAHRYSVDTAMRHAHVGFRVALTREANVASR